MVTITSAMSIQPGIIWEPVSSSISSYNVSLVVNHCPLSPAHVWISYDVFFFLNPGCSTNNSVICLNLIKLISKVLEDSICNWIVAVGMSFRCWRFHHLKATTWSDELRQLIHKGWINIWEIIEVISSNELLRPLPVCNSNTISTSLSSWRTCRLISGLPAWSAIASCCYSASWWIWCWYFAFLRWTSVPS